MARLYLKGAYLDTDDNTLHSLNDAGEYELLPIGGGGGVTIYTGDGSLAGNRVVSLNDKTLNFDRIKINTPDESNEKISIDDVDSGEGTHLLIKGSDTADVTANGGYVKIQSGGYSSGAVIDVEVDNPGTGYTGGDVLTIVGGDNNATLTVGDVGEDGDIFGASVLNPGSGYPSGTYPVTGGSGSGATFVVTAGSPGSYVYVSHLDDIDIFGGDSKDASHHASGVSMLGGRGFDTSLGGQISIQGGNGGNNGQGGRVSVTAGDAGGGDNNGGNIDLVTGAKSGGGSDGNLTINGNAGASATLTVITAITVENGIITSITGT